MNGKPTPCRHTYCATPNLSSRKNPSARPAPNPKLKFMDPMPAHHGMGTAGKAKGRQDDFTNFDGLVQQRMERTFGAIILSTKAARPRASVPSDPLVVRRLASFSQHSNSRYKREWLQMQLMGKSRRTNRRHATRHRVKQRIMKPNSLARCNPVHKYWPRMGRSPRPRNWPRPASKSAKNVPGLVLEAMPRRTIPIQLAL